MIAIFIASIILNVRMYRVNPFYWDVSLRCRHLLSAGRKLSLLGFACGVSAFPLPPAGVKCLPLHYTIVLKN